MPWVDGVRVSQEVWNRLHPIGPRYMRDAEGNRYTTYVGEVELSDPEAAAARVTANMEEAQTAARAAAIAEALAIEPGDPRMSDIDVGEPEVRDHMARNLGSGRDIPEPNRELAAPEERPAAPRGTPEGHRDAREVAATGWAAENGLPRHNAKRRSQTPVGRHSRYVRAKAEEWGVTAKVADSRIIRHPPACQWRQELES